MRTVTNLQHPGLPIDLAARPFARDEQLIVGLDCDWAERSRSAGQNRVFCYSLVFASLPPEPMPLGAALCRVGFHSLFTASDDEIDELCLRLDSDLQQLLASDSMLAGHQLPTDLAVTAASTGTHLPGVAKALAAWRDRRGAGRVFDTRHDLPPSVAGPGRGRLVDACVYAGLEVSEPELRGASMTAVRRAFLATGDDGRYERLAVVNLRHSLSTVALALVGLGHATPEPVNLNDVLRAHLWDRIPYLASAEFDRIAGRAC